MAKDNTFSGMAHNALTAETTIVGKIVSQKDIRMDDWNVRVRLSSGRPVR